MTESDDIQRLLAADNQSLRFLRENGTCLHPDGCAKAAVDCHTVQRRGDGLALIARAGQVYAHRSDLVELHKHAGNVDLTLVSTRQARTFRGFCATHDDNLFAPLEKRPFDGSSRQLGLLMYRTVAHVLWKKRTIIAAHDRLRGAFVIGDLDSRLAGMHDLRPIEMADLHELAISQRLKTSLDAMLVAGDWAKLQSMVVWLDVPPPVMVCASTYPKYDFFGAQLQDLSGPAPDLETIAISGIAASDGRGAFVLSWLRDAESAKALAKSVLRLKKPEIPAAVIRFIFQFAEDACVSPTWWEGLPAGQRRLLLAHLNDGASPVVANHPDWFDRRRRLDVASKVTAVEFL